MLYTLENGDLRVQVSDLGAEWQSVVSKRDGTEYLWHGDGAYWNRRAPLLFPICGRLTGGEYTLGGKTYRMGTHGFARDRVWTVVSQSAVEIRLRLDADDRSREMFPFDFTLEAAYRLSGNTLEAAVTVGAPGAEPLSFGLGGHPGFMAPLTAGETFEDYRLEFGDAPVRPVRIGINAAGYLEGADEPFPLTDDRTLPLKRDLFLRDGIFLRGSGHTVTMISGRSGRGVTLDYPDVPYLGIWQPIGEPPFLCLEPWAGLPAVADTVDDWATKRAHQTVAPGEERTFRYAVTCF